MPIFATALVLAMTEWLSHERIVATLRLRIKTLEDRNRELTEQLEAAYGRLAVAQLKPGLLQKRQCRLKPRERQGG
jgi:hypothetical protein